MVQTKSFIEREKPGLGELIEYLEWQDRQIDRRANAIGDAERPMDRDGDGIPDSTGGGISPPGGSGGSAGAGQGTVFPRP